MNRFLEIQKEDGTIDDLFLMVEINKNEYINISSLLETDNFYQYQDGKFNILDNRNIPLNINVYQKTPWYDAIKLCGSIPCTDGAIITNILEYNKEKNIVKTALNQWWNIKNTAYSHSLSRLAQGDIVITNNVKTIRTGLYARDSIPDYSGVLEGIVDHIDFSDKQGQHKAHIIWNNESTSQEEFNQVICVKKYTGQILLPVYFNQKQEVSAPVKKFRM